uniref:Putative secreted protein n=1 Tax=Anopheles marajoara TaxID=58244 RepID=A0A2M4C5K2_9DIPT
MAVVILLEVVDQLRLFLVEALLLHLIYAQQKLLVVGQYLGALLAQLLDLLLVGNSLLSGQVACFLFGVVHNVELDAQTLDLLLCLKQSLLLRLVNLRQIPYLRPGRKQFLGRTIQLDVLLLQQFVQLQVPFLELLHRPLERTVLRQQLLLELLQLLQTVERQMQVLDISLVLLLARFHLRLKDGGFRFEKFDQPLRADVLLLQHLRYDVGHVFAQISCRHCCRCHRRFGRDTGSATGPAGADARPSCCCTLPVAYLPLHRDGRDLHQLELLLLLMVVQLKVAVA